MSSARWLVLALTTFGALAWWLIRPAVGPFQLLPDHGIYPAGSKIADEHALGGFGPSGNFPKELADQAWGTPGEVSVVAFPDEAVPRADRPGFVVRIVNRTDSAVGFTACDSCLYLRQEARNRSGHWRPIERPPVVICGNSFHRVFLDRNQYWEFAARRTGGTFKTRLRFRLE